MAKKSNASAGPTQRQLRVGELIRRVLAETLARGDLHDQHGVADHVGLALLAFRSLWHAR